jgi:serine/threonine protein phosphatase PrpC
MALSDPQVDGESDQQTAAESAAWWESSEPALGAAPPKSQTAEVRHGEPGAPAPSEEASAALPDTIPLDESETPTAPYRVLSEEQIAAARAAGVSLTDSASITEPLEETRQLASDSAPALTAVRSRQGLAAMAARDIGRVREVNQDSVFAMLTTLPREGGEVPVGLFVVADGMGGHQGGEVASRLAVRTVVHHVLSQLVLPALDDRLAEALQPMLIGAVQAANEAIWDSAQVMGSDMGTTCTAALLVGGSLYLAHVGDSRCYLFEPGGLRQLSTDHSTVGRLIQLGQLDPSEAREHPLRNQLYRTIGQQPQVMVDFAYQTLGQGSHLLLCSDGLWGMVDEALMEQALLRSPWPQDACNELIALANLAGGDDNISAVVVTLPVIER